MIMKKKINSVQNIEECDIFQKSRIEIRLYLKEK